MSTTVTIPVRATVADAYQLLKCVAQIEKGPPGRVLLDATDTERFGPMGVALLAMAAVRRRSQGQPPIEIEWPEVDIAREYLQEVGFVRVLEAPPTEEVTPAFGTLEIAHLIGTHGPHFFPPEVSRLVRERVPGNPEDSAYLVQFCLTELLQNVLDHSGSSLGYIVHARWYAADQNVRLAVVDGGIGIPAALRKHQIAGTHKLNDQDVIKAAVTQQGLTSRKGERLGGLGLKLIREYVTKRAGSVTVVSHTGKVTFRSSGDRRVKVPFYRGTAVEVDFRPFSNIPDQSEGIF